MTGQPLISIVTPSFNQGRYLRETLESLVAQNYSNLEVIIQDGGSTDGAIAIASEFVDRFPHVFKLFVEKDSGQADALNRGFARASGEILGFLNSDDTLYPGCLASVAREIDPKQNRLIVMGRCLFTGENSVYVGVEHPSSFKSRFEQLAIWKRGYNTTPQPSVFWHRKVWTEDGGFDVTEQHALDYDLFCRFSRKHRFHEVDELWSTYRMHADSKSFQRSETEILALSIEISRRYWGSWLSLTRWRCEISFWLYGQHRHEKARHHARRCEEAVAVHKRFRALVEFIRTAFHSPQMARDRLLVPYAGAKGLVILQRILINPEGGFTGRYDADCWVGPLYRQEMSVPKNAARLILFLQHDPQGNHHTPVNVTFRLNKTLVAKKKLSMPGQTVLETDVRDLQGRKCVVELQADRYFVPRMVHKVPDDRRLSFQLMDARFEGVEDSSTDRDANSHWISPLYREEIFIAQNNRRLVVFVRHSPEEGGPRVVKIILRLNQKEVVSRTFTHAGNYAIEANVEALQGTACVIELRSDQFQIASNGRKQSIQLVKTQCDGIEAGFVGRFDGDSYVGPLYRHELLVPSHAIRYTVKLQHLHQGEEFRTVNVTLYLNGKPASIAECREEGEYILAADLRSLRDKLCIIELHSDNVFVPRDIHNAPDDRLLSVKLIETKIEPTEDSFTGRYKEDSFVGPHYCQEMARPNQPSRIIAIVRHMHHGNDYRDVNTTLLINSVAVVSRHCAAPGEYALEADLDASTENTCMVELRSDNYFIPQEIHHVPDERKLSLQLISIRIEGRTVEPSVT